MSWIDGLRQKPMSRLYHLFTLLLILLRDLIILAVLWMLYLLHLIALVLLGVSLFLQPQKTRKSRHSQATRLRRLLKRASLKLRRAVLALYETLSPTLQQVLTQLEQLRLRLASRTRQIDSSSFGSSSTLNADNFIPVRSNGRYHKVRVNLSGDWSRAQGIDVDATALGRR